MKVNKEVTQAQLDEEKKLIKLLKVVYKQAKKDCEEKIRQLSARTDMENLQSIVYQQQYQEALKKQLEGILDSLQTEEFASISDYLQRCYENGYAGNMYELHKQDIPVVMPIRQDNVVRALQTDSQLSTPLYKALGEDVDYLKKSIRAELSRGIANGSSWNEMAGHIANGMNSPYKKAYNRAILIARTEGHRIYCQSNLDSAYEAKKQGAESVKQWDATLDERTRLEHREVDGQIRELDEPFDVGGEKMQATGLGGSAKNVCNCRCALNMRPRWALDEDELQTLKDRAEYFGLDKAKDFDDFREKYLNLPKNANYSEQRYRPVEMEGMPITIEKNRKAHTNANVKKVKAYDYVYVSEGVKIKPKALHQINQNTNKALENYGLNYEEKPTIVIFSMEELGALGKYDAINNTVYYIPEIADKGTEGGKGYTEYHEMWHAKQASDYGMEIVGDNYTEYMKALMKKAKRHIDKLGITRENVSELSTYAKDCYNVGRYDEVEAEYMAANRKRR